jgi:uncharacterized metal-binding protein
MSFQLQRYKALQTRRYMWVPIQSCIIHRVACNVFLFMCGTLYSSMYTKDIWWWHWVMPILLCANTALVAAFSSHLAVVIVTLQQYCTVKFTYITGDVENVPHWLGYIPWHLLNRFVLTRCSCYLNIQDTSRRILLWAIPCVEWFHRL